MEKFKMYHQKSHKPYPFNATLFLIEKKNSLVLYIKIWKKEHH